MNSRKQRLQKLKAELVFLTIYTDSNFLASIVDTYKDRAIAVVDVPGTYLSAEIDEFLILKFIDKQVDNIYIINLDYEKYIIKKEKEEYYTWYWIKLFIYGVQSTLLSYRYFAGVLIEIGFEINPSDLHIANKTMYSK